MARLTGTATVRRILCRTARVLVLAWGWAAVSPASAAPQLNVLGGVGLTSPVGDFSDTSSAGWHVRVAAQLGLPALPVGVRVGGDYHRLGASDTSRAPPRVLAGGLSLVFDLPGVGLTPYLLGGADRARIERGQAGLATRAYRHGVHLGFGVGLGALAFGSFAEIRYVRVNDPAGDLALVPISIGLRF